MKDYDNSPINALSSAARCIHRDNAPLQKVVPDRIVSFVVRLVEILFKQEYENCHDVGVFLHRVVNDEEPLWWDETKQNILSIVP